MAIFGVSELRNPWTDRLKLDTRDYVGELTSCAKFHKIRRHKDLPAIYTSRTFLYFYEGDFSRASTEKILNNVKRLMN